MRSLRRKNKDNPQRLLKK